MFNKDVGKCFWTILKREQVHTFVPRNDFCSIEREEYNLFTVDDRVKLLIDRTMQEITSDPYVSLPGLHQYGNLSSYDGFLQAFHRYNRANHVFRSKRTEGESPIFLRCGDPIVRKIQKHHVESSTFEDITIRYKRVNSKKYISLIDELLR